MPLNRAQPPVDVIIPAFQAEEWILEALRSVRAQSYGAWRAIVVDDGSLDRTAAIVEGEALSEPRIRLIRAEHDGPSAARNHALREADGKYLAFLDADDVWHPDKLAVQVELLESHPEYGACYTWFDCIDGAGRCSRPVETLIDGFWHAAPPDALSVVLGHAITGSPSSVVMRAELLPLVGLFDESMSYAEDREYWYRVARHARFGLIKSVLVHYRMLPNTTHWKVYRSGVGMSAFLRKVRPLLAPRERRRLRWLKILSLLQIAYGRLMLSATRVGALKRLSAWLDARLAHVRRPVVRACCKGMRKLLNG